MKYVKMLGLLAVAATAVMAFAAETAPAAVVTSPKGTTYTSTIKAASEKQVEIVGPLNIKLQCQSGFEGKIEKHGAGVTAAGNITNLTFTECAESYGVKVLSNGSLEFHVTGGGNGTVTSSGAEITVITPLGFNCIYKTSATDIGTLTGSSTTGKTATLDVHAFALPRTGHSAFCGGSGEWNGSYLINTPDFLDLS
jgi:hypothetical protein